MKKADFVVYLIYNMKNGKYYVGQSRRGVRTRWKQHVSDAMRGQYQTSYIHRAIRKHGPDSFRVAVLAQPSTEEEMNDLEKVWVERLQASVKGKGYNRTRGGIGLQFPTKDVRRRMSAKLKQAWANPETRARMKPWTKEAGNPRFRSEVSTAKVLELYQTGMSMRQIARHLGVKDGLIFGRLRRSGVPRRSRSDAQKMLAQRKVPA